jgi:hypothetical protein
MIMISTRVVVGQVGLIGWRDWFRIEEDEWVVDGD